MDWDVAVLEGLSLQSFNAQRGLLLLMWQWYIVLATYERTTAVIVTDRITLRCTVWNKAIQARL
jgi:hypothetical protein